RPYSSASAERGHRTVPRPPACLATVMSQRARALRQQRPSDVLRALIDQEEEMVSMDTQPHRSRRFRMQHLLVGLIAVAAVLAPFSASAEAATSGEVRSGALPCNLPTPFRRDAFTHSTRINNQWLPLTPGAQFTLTGTAISGAGTQPHTVILTVTDLYKVIRSEEHTS